MYLSDRDVLSKQDRRTFKMTNPIKPIFSGKNFGDPSTVVRIIALTLMKKSCLLHKLCYRDILNQTQNCSDIFFSIYNKNALSSLQILFKTDDMSTNQRTYRRTNSSNAVTTTSEIKEAYTVFAISKKELNKDVSAFFV